MRYLTVGEIAEINERLLGPDRLSNFGLLESAVMRPQQTVFGSDAYPDIHSKAAALLHSHAIIRFFTATSGRTACGHVVLRPKTARSWKWTTQPLWR